MAEKRVKFGENAVALANDFLRRGYDIVQIWTCRKRGSLQTMEKKNQLYSGGTCGKCGGSTKFETINFLAYKEREEDEVPSYIG